MDTMTIQIIIALIGVAGAFAGAFAGIFIKFGKVQATIEIKFENIEKVILSIQTDISTIKSTRIDDMREFRANISEMNKIHTEDMREFRIAHEESLREIRGVFTKHIENPMAHGNWSADASKA